MNNNPADLRKRFTPVHDFHSFTPLTVSSASPTPPTVIPPPPPPMDSPTIASPSKSPRFVRPTSIIIPPTTGNVVYYLKESSGMTGSGTGVDSSHHEEEIEDDELSKYPDNQQRDRQYDSLVVLPTFYTHFERESLVFSSNLQIPEIIIPEDRIRTPRTPRTPSNRKSFGQSPSDMMLQTEDKKSPSEIMKGKFRATFHSQKIQI